MRDFTQITMATGHFAHQYVDLGDSDDMQNAVYSIVKVKRCRNAFRINRHVFHLKKLKAKARDSYIARLTGKLDQPRFTIIEVAVDRQEPMVLQR